MKDVLIDQNGAMRCPKCRGSNFDRERSTKGKVLGAATVGVGVLLVPKRLKCLSCGTVAKSGSAVRWTDPALVPAAPPMRVVKIDKNSSSPNVVLISTTRSAYLTADALWKVFNHNFTASGMRGIVNAWFPDKEPLSLGEVDEADLIEAVTRLAAEGVTIRYVEDAVPTAQRMIDAAPSVADEIAKLAALRDSGALDDAEFAAAKAKLLA